MTAREIHSINSGCIKFVSLGYAVPLWVPGLAQKKGTSKETLAPRPKQSLRWNRLGTLSPSRRVQAPTYYLIKFAQTNSLRYLKQHTRPGDVRH